MVKNKVGLLPLLTEYAIKLKQLVKKLINKLL